MDGSYKSIIVSGNYANFQLVFALDRSQQILYWINGTRHHHCYLQRSNTDGSNISVVYNATSYSGGCSTYYQRYYSTQPAISIDFFGGAVYTHSPYHKIQITSTEGRPYSTSYNYMSYICGGYNQYHGIKVISRQRQLQGITIYNNIVMIHACSCIL